MSNLILKYYLIVNLKEKENFLQVKNKKKIV